MRRKAELFPGRFDVNRLRGIKHLRDWDDAFQPYNGFRDAAEYYAHASSLPYLPQIRIPALIITAEDDPFIPIQSFYDKRLTENPSICLLAPRHGGHVAFCGRGSDAEDRAWGLMPPAEYAAAVWRTVERDWVPRFSARGIDGKTAWERAMKLPARSSD